MSATKAVKATELNVWVLARISMGRETFANQIEAVSAPHMRRCMKAGLVEVVDRTTLRLTAAGFDALRARKAELLKSAEIAYQNAHETEQAAVARVTSKTPKAETDRCWMLADRTNKARDYRIAMEAL